MKRITYIKSHKKILKIEVSGEDQQVNNFAEEFESKFDIDKIFIVR